MAKYSLPPAQEDYYETWRERRAFLHHWFTDLYFDPEHEQAQGISRHYRWSPGAVVDPLDELLIAFGTHAERHILEEVAEELASQSKNWRARPDEIDPALVGRPAVVGDVVGSRLWIMPDEMRRDILNRITDLERAITTIAPPEPSFGHNNPPEPLEDRPATKADIEALEITLGDIRSQVQASRPDVQTLSNHKSALIEWAGKVTAWVGARATKFADEAVASAGKVAGPVAILAIAGLVPKVEALAAAIEATLRYLSN